ncbi:AMP-binding protein [Chloroflexota bacterium]
MHPTRYTKAEFNQLADKGYWAESVDYEEENAKKYPDKEGFVDSRNRLTFSQMQKMSNRLALGFIEMGLKKDQIIVMQIPNCAEYFIVRSAAKKAGLIILFTQMNMRHSEMKFACRQTGAVGAVIITESRGFDYFKMVKELRPDLPDLKYVFIIGDQVPEGAISITEMMERPLDEKCPPDYFEKSKIKPGEINELKMTSGTTGFPKLTENSYGAPGDREVLLEKYKITHDDIFAALAPLTGGASGSGICKGICQQAGCKLIMLERFDAEEALKLIDREMVSFATGVPTMMSMMITHPDFKKYDLKSLRIWHTASAYLPPGLAKEVEEKMDCRIVNHFGGIDVGFATTTSVDDPLKVRLSSVGNPMPNITLKLIDEHDKEVPQGEIGEIIFGSTTGRARNGYYKDPEATLARETQGLSRTGDLGKLDEQGNLYIVGRKKDVIIRGGQNIFPAEIESILITHPKVAYNAIVGMPDPVMGEKVCAYIIPRRGQILTFDEMIFFLLEKKMAKYKLPERLELVDSFPMSGEGQKILKRELTERVTKKLKAEGVIV